MPELRLHASTYCALEGCVEHCGVCGVMPRGRSHMQPAAKELKRRPYASVVNQEHDVRLTEISPDEPRYASSRMLGQARLYAQCNGVFLCVRHPHRFGRRRTNQLAEHGKRTSQAADPICPGKQPGPAGGGTAAGRRTYAAQIRSRKSPRSGDSTRWPGPTGAPRPKEGLARHS